LKALKKPTPREYWLTWIAHGKSGTLMPAFWEKSGGPLTDAQVHTLADYLLQSR
jgi:hypothetical protein